MAQAAHVGLAGLGIATAIRSPAWCARISSSASKKLALRYHPGARLVFADGTPDILAYPRDRAAWGRLCRLLTLGNLRAEKGGCILDLGDLLAHVEGLELIVMDSSSRELATLSMLQKPTSPPASPSPRRSGCQGCQRARQGHPACFYPATPTLPPGEGEAAELWLVETRKADTEPKDSLSLLREAAPGRVRLAATMLYRGDDRARLARRADRRAAGVPLDRGQRRALPSPRPARLQDVLTCIREKTDHRPRRPAARRQCRASSQAAGRNGAAVPRRAGGDRRDAALSSSAHLLARRTANTNIPTRPRRLCHAAGGAGASHRGRRCRSAIPTACRQGPPRHSTHELALIAQAQLRALFPHRPRHRALRPQRRASSARAAARRPIPRSAIASASPRSTRRDGDLLFERFISRGARASRPTSTSISSTSGAKR